MTAVAYGSVSGVEVLEGALDALFEDGAAAFTSREQIERLYRARQRLEAFTAEASAAFDAGGDWQGSGARSAKAYLGHTLNQPFSVGGASIEAGRDLRTMPAVRDAWAAGELTAAHVRLLAEALELDTEAFARDEQLLVGYGKVLRFAQFQRVLGTWRYHADPDGAEDDAARKAGLNKVHLSKTIDDRFRLDGWLDPIGGTIVQTELRRLERGLFEAEWAETKQRLGRDITAADLARTPAQRRAAALVQMAERSAAMPAGARRPEPLFTVLVGTDALRRTVELANRMTLTPGALVPWLEYAWVERVVFDAKSRPIDVSVRKRLFTGATRRGIEVRDRECQDEFCDVPADWCDADHDQPFSKGGQTTVDNGKLRCGWHNRRKGAG